VLLTISTTRDPATDLGFLLHKHPGRVQSFEVAVGTAHVFYPRAEASLCTAALLLEVDPIGLVRGTGRRGRPGGPVLEAFTLGQYVNDRPYAASSMLAVALGKVFRTAMTGRCDARPDLAAGPLPLQLRVPALRCRGGHELAEQLFAPLGWQVAATTLPLDETFPQWGDSRYVDLRLTGELRLADALNHLYVLLPVLDDAKHYWVSPDEVDKLVRAGGGWLGGHPLRGLISRRYLAHRWALTRTALARLAEVDDTEPESLDDAVPPDAGDLPADGEAPDAGAAAAGGDPAAAAVGGEPGAGAAGGGGELDAREAAAGGDPDAGAVARVPLARLRREAVLDVLRQAGARRVADLGCGEGALVADLLAERAIQQVLAVDVSVRALEVAARKLRVDRMPAIRRAKLQLLQSALTYRDSRLAGLDAAVLQEVIEHVDPPRLAALERTVFGDAAPGTVVVTTPNVEHNVRYPGLAPGAFRHRDHRFEWTRAEFAGWAEHVGRGYGYHVRLFPVGDDDPEVGPPTQLAVFTRGGVAR
jgi:SAM-dependent methyltransferase